MTPPTRERAPSMLETRPESPTEVSDLTLPTTGTVATPTDSSACPSLGCIHAAFVAGYELGKAERVEAEIEDRVLARLHQRSLEALGMGRRLASAKGPAWAAMIAEAGEAR